MVLCVTGHLRSGTADVGVAPLTCGCDIVTSGLGDTVSPGDFKSCAKRHEMNVMGQIIHAILLLFIAAKAASVLELIEKLLIL